MKTGVELITDERQRQIKKEKWSSRHDDEHDESELTRAAECYCKSSRGLLLIEHLWPWSMKWWKPSTPIRDLVKAGALIAAEIDRRQRILLLEQQLAKEKGLE